jgi:hypothetical protein
MNLIEIKKAVEQETEQDITVNNRRRETVYARSIYYKLCRIHTRATLSRIAKTVNKNHATILHGIKLYDDVIRKYDDLKEYKNVYDKLDRVFKRINNTTQKQIDPESYYRNKLYHTLLELRITRNENRMLKKQLTLN